MAVLRDMTTGRLITLHAEHLVGRSRRCDLQLDAPSVSSQHATLRWTGARWVLRDLGSRNGTLLDGALLPAGEHPLTKDSLITFGTDACRWVLDSDQAPVPTAAPMDDKSEPVAGVEGLLVLPADTDMPQLNVYLNQQDQWIGEWVDGTEVLVNDLEVINVEGRDWRLHLPIQALATMAVASAAPTLESVRFCFEATRDLETVSLTIEWGEESWDLGARAHHAMLMELAKRRKLDEDEDDTERGWAYADQLVKDLGVTEGTLSVYIFRARQQVASCGIEGAQNLVERRRPTRQLRFGGSIVEIKQH